MMLDITDDIKHSLLGSYADDTRIWRLITGRKDQNLLQEDLNRLYQWALRNNMEYNGPKFEATTFGKESKRCYKAPDGKPIQRKDTIKDLGVYVSNDLDFNEHINITVKGGQRVANWTLRIQE